VHVALARCTVPDDFIYLTTHSGYAQIAVVMGTARGELTDEALSRIAIEKLIDLLADAGLRKTLADIGVQAEQLQPIAEQSFSVQCLVNNSPVPLGVDSLLTIANAAYTGTILVKAA
jgi:alcohol dehydrogenase class IV